LGRLHVYEVPVEDPPAGTSVAAQPMQEAQEAPWIDVNGSGSVQVEADRARVTFAMETRAAAADAAAEANADAMAAVLAAIRGGGFEGIEIETFGYSLRPEYTMANDQRTRQIVAYAVVNNVGATIHDVDAVGRLVDVAIGAGANRVGGISFFAADTEGARHEALAQAVRAARAEAVVMAEALGHRLGPVLQISGGAERPVPRMVQADMMLASARAVETPIEAGEQTVTASVHVRFALGPELGG